MQLLHVVARPDLRTQETEAHLDQPVVQVDENHIITSLGDIVVEGDGPDLLGVGMFEPLQASRP